MNKIVLLKRLQKLENIYTPGSILLIVEEVIITGGKYEGMSLTDFQTKYSDLKHETVKIVEVAYS